MHETPSSHIAPIEPFNPDPIPGQQEMTITYSDGRVVIHIFRAQTLPIIEFARKVSPPTIDTAMPTTTEPLMHYISPSGEIYTKEDKPKVIVTSAG